MAALSFLLFLEQQDAVQKLEQRVRILEEEIEATEIGLKKASAFVARINLIESEYLLAMRRAELKWVRGLLSELRSGRLGWDIKKVFREVRNLRKAAATLQEK